MTHLDDLRTLLEIATNEYNRLKGQDNKPNLVIYTINTLDKRIKYLRSEISKFETILKDIESTDEFDKNEIQYIDNNYFSSWEYSNIKYLTNEEFYYLSDEETDFFQKNADKETETEKGIIFCFS